MRHPLKIFAPYASQFEAFVDSRAGKDTDSAAGLVPFEGLEPYQALRSLVPVEELRSLGIFFTGADIAGRLWEPVLGTLTPDSIVVDPACGVGDLLLRPAAFLAENHESAILSYQIRGSDLEDAFLRTARARMRFTHGHRAPGETFQFFEQRDFLADPGSIVDASHVVMNPPFFPMQAPESCRWAAGKVNSAALFVMAALEAMNEGSRLLAVLPDVLRSGARYEKWRSRVADFAEVVRVEPLGQFDTETDVHVFILDVVIRPSHADQARQQIQGWTKAESSRGATVADHFEVRVGPVVPHRDPETGPEVPFLTTKNILSKEGNRPTRRYSGRLYSGPMVLVSRTSRPGQSPRARATLLQDKASAAVENHLLVLKPLDQSVDSCHRLVALLNDPRTTDFLDERIRCRHLTVGAVRDIPWLEMEQL